MKKFIRPLILLFFQFFCINAAFSQTYVWTQKADFAGGVRYFPAGFSIGNTGYVGLGKENGIFLNDFWAYDPTLDAWIQKASMPDSGRVGAVGFSINGKGYISTGWWTTHQLHDLWEYDPLTNNWTQKANFGGAGRYTATSFVTDSFAYVGCGYSPYQNDFWKYDPVLDIWTQIANIGGIPRAAPAAFSIGNQGYVLGGGVQFGTFIKALWNYNEPINTWTQKADLPGDARNGCIGFSINGKGFAGIGQNDTMAYKDFYQYDPANDTWSQSSDFGGGLRQGCVAFTIGNAGYCGLGSSTLFPNLNNHQDWWSFQEITSSSIPEVVKNSFNTLFVLPNPNDGKFILSFNAGENSHGKFEIMNTSGQVILTMEVGIKAGKNQCRISEKLKPGIYIIRVKHTDTTWFTKFLVI